MIAKRRANRHKNTEELLKLVAATYEKGISLPLDDDSGVL